MSSYDDVALGSSAYVGILDKTMKEFTEAQEEALLQKKLYFLILGIKRETFEGLVEHLINRIMYYVPPCKEW
ncbi:hypothetical protein [Amedibacillus sp. YH-ame10]